MTVCLVWLGDAGAAEVLAAGPGPWRELVEAGPGMLLVETDETVSRLYHEVKWLLPESCALLVAPVSHRPKVRGLTPGSASWLRDRLPLPDREEPPAADAPSSQSPLSS